MKKITITLLCLFILFPFFSQAQDSLYARKIIAALSADCMKGRGASYHGDSIAAAYLAGEMQRLGVYPLSYNYLQKYSAPSYSIDGPIHLSINGCKLQPYRQFRICSASRFATPDNLIQTQRTHKPYQMKDGTWIIGVRNLDTYSPIVGKGSEISDSPVAIEVLDSLLPKHIRKVQLDLPLHFHEDYTSQNVVGYIPGISDTMIVFTAHYDHCGTMGDSIIFPGAHDNASGTAAVMDLARHFSINKPYYTMVFMLFSGEETGLKGSRYAAEHQLIDYSKVKLLCNIDMFCGGDEGIMVFNATSEETKPFFDCLVRLNEKQHIAPELRPRKNSPNSDHYPFSNLCPSLFFLTMGQPYGGYHDPSDTCAACGLGHYHDYLSLILSLVQQ